MEANTDIKIVDQDVLVRLSNARFRPGGKLASRWLIKNGDFNRDSKVLEVICNTGNTAIQLAQKYSCHVIGIDVDEDALVKARANIKKYKLTDLIEVQQVNLTTLPFEDNSFDIVINEAMLTTLPLEDKARLVTEYYRVLKPNGLLLTQDLLLPNTEHQTDIVQQLNATINIELSPLTRKEWKHIFTQAGFRNVDIFTGPMTLVSLTGAILEEGVFQGIKSLKNSLKIKTIAEFRSLHKLYNDKDNFLRFIAVCSQK